MVHCAPCRYCCLSPNATTIGPLLTLIVFSKVKVVLLAMLAYVSFVVLIFHWLHLGHRWMLKDALFWFFGTAIIVLFTTNQAGKEKHYIRKIALDNLKFAVVLDFVVNLYVFNLAVELVLLPFLAMLAMLSVVAVTKDEYKPAKSKHSPGGRRVMGGAVSGLVLRGEPLCGWLPGAAAHELVQDFHGTASVLAGGVDVAADVEAVLGDVVAGEAAGDVLLDFQGADAAL